MELSVSEISRIIGCGEVSDSSRRITTLLTDSRVPVENPASTIFFAIKTRSGDGHRFVRDLYNAGIRVFVTEGPVDLPSDATILSVENTVGALQAVAAYVRREAKKATVVAVTGSAGKTQVKEWLSELAGADVRSPRSYNSRIGVPLSVWQMDSDSRLAVFEAGVSRAGEMELLERILHPDVAVITTLTSEHDRGFGSLAAKADEKCLLAVNASKAVYPIDNPEIERAMAGYRGERFSWTLTGNPGARLHFTAKERDGYTSLTWEGGEVVIPFTADADVENAASCIATMSALGLPVDSEAFAGLHRTETRLEVIEGAGGCQIVVDRFSPDVLSLAGALDFARRRLTPEMSLTAILGDIQGDPSELLKRYGVSRVITIGHDGDYSDTAAFLAANSPADFRAELIVVKGAPEQGFEAIAEMLAARQHQTLLEVDLGALRDNYNFFRSKVRPETGIVCMVKAFGYGAGSYELAKTLQSQGAAYLAVAAHDEGAELRRAGITMPIMVLNPRVDNYLSMFTYRLEPEIYSLDILAQVIAEAAKWGIHDFPVHIKLDTGMHRLGFLESELPQVIEMIRAQDGVTIKSIFSHLCAADDPNDDEYTRLQFETFDRCCATIAAAFPERRILRHILNSTGIVRFPEHQGDLVRLGIGLYGIKTLDDGSMDALRPVSALSSVIISIREWPADTTIGYNRRGRLDRPSRIATIPIGYADGIDRHLGYGNLRVDVGGRRCPTVGSICMDVMMIDVTDAPEARVGDRVEIFGTRVPAAELAETLTTIPYEILTSVSTRVKRVYFRD